jgi:hypothetical protein
LANEQHALCDSVQQPWLLHRDALDCVAHECTKRLKCTR